MPKVTDTLLNELFAVYVVVFLIGAAFGWAYKRRIREYHPMVWADLGAPSFLNNSILNGFRSTHFLLSKRYEQLNDPTLNFYGRWARVGLLGIAFFIGLFLVLMLIGQYQNGLWQHPHFVVSHPLNAVGAAILGFVAVNLLGYSLLTKRLRSRHPQVWNELGQPSFLNNTAANGWKLMQFVWSARHRELSDRGLSLYIFLMRILSFAVCALFFAAIMGALRS
jgi:hypothetical protein